MTSVKVKIVGIAPFLMNKFEMENPDENKAETQG